MSTLDNPSIDAVTIPNGRSPEATITTMVTPTSLERPGSPIPISVQWAQKKGRNLDSANGSSRNVDMSDSSALINGEGKRSTGIRSPMNVSGFVSIQQSTFVQPMAANVSGPISSVESSGVVFEVPPVVTSRPPVLPSPLPPPSAAAACSMHVGTSAQGSFVAISPQSTDHVSIQSHSLEVHSNNVNNVMFPVALVEEVVQGNTPLISSKGVARKEMKSKKKGDRISSKPSLINLVNVISLELDKVAATASKQVAPSPSISAVGVDEVQWRENSTFTVTENVDM
ncbi:hypothetical protein V6N11_057157 [Hibiscus sabdariffa]|uniref:Uncharacterized protein n=2 Tax=Hibiscus sabdariffa TaxID=183260 RepID=A0ABR2B145_9ROSI